jgi:lipoprotein signal peptidase
MPERSYRALLWALALTGLLADQVTKYGVFGWLSEGEDNRYSLLVLQGDEQKGLHLNTRFEIKEDGGRGPHVNQGALFGFLRDHKTGANLGFAVISLLAAVAIAFWSTQKATAADPWLCAALGLILAGTLGNFYDRLVFDGVRDFLHWDYLFDWPVFNVADSCLVCGAGLLLIQAFSRPARTAPRQPEVEVAKQAAAALSAPAPAAGVTCDAGIPSGSQPG